MESGFSYMISQSHKGLEDALVYSWYLKNLNIFVSDFKLYNFVPAILL